MSWMSHSLDVYPHHKKMDDIKVPIRKLDLSLYYVLALRMYPGCEKVDSKVTAKTTLECISDLIQ